MTHQGCRMMDEGRQTPDNAKGMAQAPTVELSRTPPISEGHLIKNINWCETW